MEHDTNGPIVVGVDFSPASLAAIEYGAAQAAGQHRPLVLVHGYDNFARVGVPGITGFDLSMTHEAERRLTEVCRQVAVEHPELEVTGKVRQSSGAAALVDESQRAALVVVASRGHGALHQLVAGSVAAQTSAHALCPVAVVRPMVDEPAKDRESDPGPVVVGIDGSGYADAATEFAFAEASRRGVPLVGVSVWGLGDLSDVSETLPWGEGAGEWRRRMTDDTDRLLAESLSGHADRYPDVEVHKVVAYHLSPWQGLRDAAVDVGAGLIVVGSRGLGGFAGLFLGSVSQRLVSDATCDVTVVRGEKDPVE